MNTWYIQRLKTMTLSELAYRAEQKLQSRRLKKQMGQSISVAACETVPEILPAIDHPLEATAYIDVFGIMVNPAEITDWSYDVLNKRSFPLKYAKDINMRTAEYGSAKHVWEVNRMLFLPRLAMLYKSTGDMQYVNLIMRLVSSWVQQNPYLTGINWYSNIEVNIRLINWFLTWELLQAEELAQQHPSFSKFINEVWVPSIYRHCTFSYVHPSLHSSSNNHLISEYAGLFVASSKWLFKESRSWNRYAKKGMEKEIIRQHSPNGINREEAAEYIQFITDFFLIALLVGDYTNNAFSAAYKEMFRNILHYINVMLTVSGKFPKYGDEDDGRVCLLNKDIHDNNFKSLLHSGAVYFNEPDLLQEPDQKNLILFGDKAAFVSPAGAGKTLATSQFYPDEGHFFFKKQTAPGKEIYCHFDAAPLGYLSIAAHGHADALSFELHIDGQPFLVDPGTYCYHTDAEWRRYFVSTRAHNTIGIAGIDQANFVGPTLWLDHYKTEVLKMGSSDSYEYVTACHSGYRKHGVEHVRKLEFFREHERIVITDYINIKPGRAYPVEMPFHLHPSVTYDLKGLRADLTHGRRKLVVKLDQQMQWSIAKGLSNPCLGWYSDRFYSKLPSPVLLGVMHCASSLELKTELVII